MRQWIDLFESYVQESEDGWPSEITGIDLATRVEKEDLHHTPSDWQDGDIDANICAYGKYDLREVDPSTINADIHYVDDDRVDDYTETRLYPPPPIVLDHRGYIIDGSHRTKAAQRRGDKTVMAYVGDESTYDPQYEESDEWEPSEDY